MSRPRLLILRNAAETPTLHCAIQSKIVILLPAKPEHAMNHRTTTAWATFLLMAICSLATAKSLELTLLDAADNKPLEGVKISLRSQSNYPAGQPTDAQGKRSVAI